MRLFQSTIGLKILMALSGLVGLGFVVGHMLGNLQIFIPDEGESLNAYAAALHANAALLWVARSVLLASIVVHVVTVIKLNRKIKSARPIPYASKGWLGASYATRSMRIGGYTLFAFIIYHLLHLTWGAQVLPEDHMAINMIDAEHRDVYTNVVMGFKFYPTAFFYIIAQVMLGLHLTHGIHSISRTIGISNPVWTERAGKAAVAAGVGITTGNIAIVLYGMFTSV